MRYCKDNEESVIHRLVEGIDPGTCVDIGARDIEGSNVAKLILECGWSATLVERSALRVANLKQQFSGYPVNIVKHNVTTQNINKVLPIYYDLVNIDIDGQDYYIWQSLNHKARVIVIEYNPQASGTYVMPLIEKYDWKLDLDRARRGASKDSMVALGQDMGYSLAEYNSDNLFFVKDKD